MSFLSVLGSAFAETMSTVFASHYSANRDTNALPAGFHEFAWLAVRK
jgi:hypothetical protein